MRKTSIVLMASLMAFVFLAAMPQDVAVAGAGCGACKIGPNLHAATGIYDNNVQVAYSIYVGGGTTCEDACDYCYQKLYCATCIDKYGCNCNAYHAYMNCKGVPQGYNCASPI